MASSIPSSDNAPAAPPGAPIDMRRVRRLFARPARLADSQFLRREIAGRMHERLELVKLAPRLIVDAGCGEGADLPVLQHRFPEARMLGIDAASAMLAEAQRRQATASTAMHRLLAKLLPASARNARRDRPELAAADFCRLPLANACADLLWSNLALHWHSQPDRVFAEWRRVLRVDGLLMFSCFGPDTFKEVRAAFAAADHLPHVLSFIDMHDFGDMLVNSGFATPVMDMESIVVTYDSTDKLLRDVRAWGGNPLAEQRFRGLAGRDGWRRMLAALEAGRRPDGKFGLTFEIVYGHAFRPQARTTAAGESIVRFDPPRRSA